MYNNSSNQNGSAVIYIVLLMFLMMTSAAIILSGVLDRHIRSANDYLSSERAFAAANSGIEQMLYSLAKSGGSTTADDSLDYNGEKAQYKGTGNLVNGTPCMSASGTYRDIVRRIALGEGVPGCTLP
ncbi:MAG TPA: hypothetical protein VLG69_01230 [Candidatus Andersenbacteria bacterium]|nr:hypothetical protein [Candidatus Andersenbacteria bacterium]